MESTESLEIPSSKPKRDRRTRHTSLQSYIWEQVPRQLIQDAKRKAKGKNTSIKRVLLTLLRDWTYEVQP